MTTIPAIRRRLHQLADELDCPELHALADETRRRPPLRRAPARWPRLDDLQQAAVRAYFAACPDAGVRDIANRFGTSIGRVSEALRGKRL